MCSVWFSVVCYLVRYSASKLAKMMRSRQNSEFSISSQSMVSISKCESSCYYFDFNSWLVYIYSKTSCSKNYSGLILEMCLFRFFLTLIVLLVVSVSVWSFLGYSFLKTHLTLATIRTPIETNSKMLRIVLLARDGISLLI